MNPRIVRAHERHPTLTPQASDHLSDASLDDFHQCAFTAAVAVHLHHPGHRPVAVHQRAHLARERGTGRRSASSGRRNPNPSRCPMTRPVTRSIRSTSPNSPRRLRMIWPSRSMAPSRRCNASCSAGVRSACAPAIPLNATGAPVCARNSISAVRSGRFAMRVRTLRAFSRGGYGRLVDKGSGR